MIFLDRFSKKKEKAQMQNAAGKKVTMRTDLVETNVLLYFYYARIYCVYSWKGKVVKKRDS